MNRVFQRMREYAAERGNHGQISSNAMQLKDSVQEDEKDLMFNPNDYKSRYQVCIYLGGSLKLFYCVFRRVQLSWKEFGSIAFLI